jgi:transposase
LGASVGILDSTFIESAYGGPGAAASGYKRAKGHNVSVLIDKDSRIMELCVLPANLQDAEGARALLPAAKEHFPKLRKVLGDKAYRGAPIVTFAAELGIELDGDSPPLPKGTIFVPMPMRWRIEQFFAWLSKWRRIAKSWCYSDVGYAVDVYWAMFGLTLRRFA